MSTLSTPELLAPGGSLNQAVHALRAGANAIYAGTVRFSARAHAGNLDLGQFSRLCGEASRQGAQVYAALNTVLTESEIGLALDLAWELWAVGASAAIVQDIGLIYALQRFGPPLELHASTQMAVHSVSGARALADQGIKRVVLARELTVPEIAAIHEAVPETELEVFVHGALCYSVSGLCLASGLMLQRSGNRGDCGQICRTWSALDPSQGGQQRGSWFSMNDLAAGNHIQNLRSVGVASFKIEGRMKSPEWTAEVVAHYRALLDGNAPGDHLARAQQVFGRQPSSAYLGDPRGLHLINHEYAGSLGLLAGRVEEVRHGRALVILKCELAVSDGVMLLRSGSPPKAWQAGVRGLSPDGRSAIWEAKAGTRVWIQADSDGQVFRDSDTGLELRKVADHAANLPQIKPESLPAYRRQLAIQASLHQHDAVWQLELVMPELDGCACQIIVQPEKAHGDGLLAEILAGQLASGGDSGFSAAGLTDDGSLAGWFLPPRVIKEIKREWHSAVHQGFLRVRARRQTAREVERAECQIKIAAVARNQPPRSTWNPRGDLPFITSFSGLLPEHLAQWNGALVLPLAPVWFDDVAGFTALQNWLVELLQQYPQARVILGIGNWAQVNWYRRLRNLPELSRLFTGAFADYGLYAANPVSVLALSQAIPDLLLIVPWIEAGEKNGDPDFHPPLFISRACFHNQSLALGCPAGGISCPKNWDYQLEQGARQFRVLVRNCITYTF